MSWMSESAQGIGYLQRNIGTHRFPFMAKVFDAHQLSVAGSTNIALTRRCDSPAAARNGRGNAFHHLQDGSSAIAPPRALAPQPVIRVTDENILNDRELFLIFARRQIRSLT